MIATNDADYDIHCPKCKIGLIIEYEEYYGIEDDEADIPVICPDCNHNFTVHMKTKRIFS